MLAQIKNIQCYIQSRIGDFKAEIAIILGSGLSNLANQCTVEHKIDYSELTHLGFPRSTVEGHQGCFIFGTLADRKVVFMQGRFHYYEGWSMQQVVMPIRVLAIMGVKSIILSNAAGGLNPSFKVGDLMAITDHICLIPNPLIGANIDEMGARFPAMTTAYDCEYIEHFNSIASSMGITIRNGVYLATTGPSYETRAEVNYFRMIGGDAVGMSTAPEVIAAAHAGVRVFAVSVITNVANLQVSDTAPTHQEVIDASLMAGETLAKMVEKLIPMLD